MLNEILNCFFPLPVESKTVTFGFGSGTGLSFADLASSNSGDFAFGSKGKIRRRGFSDCVTEVGTPGG